MRIVLKKVDNFKWQSFYLLTNVVYHGWASQRGPARSSGQRPVNLCRHESAALTLATEDLIIRSTDQKDCTDTTDSGGGR